MKKSDRIVWLYAISNGKNFRTHALKLPCSSVLVFLRQPLHHNTPRTKMITKTTATTIPTTAPADMAFPPSDGGVKSEEKQQSHRSIRLQDRRQGSNDAKLKKWVYLPGSTEMAEIKGP